MRITMFAKVRLLTCLSAYLLTASICHAFTLAQLAPKAPAGTQAIRTDPTVIGISNAKAVYAVDFRDLKNGNNVAGVLFTLTDADTPYSHNRKTCRLVSDGASLGAVLQTQFAGAYFYTVVTESKGQVEHATQFVARVMPQNRFVVDSRYLGEQYTSQPGAFETVNAQVWSSDPRLTVALAGEVLENLRSFGSVVLRNQQSLLLPRAVIQSGSHFGHDVALSMLSNAETPEEVTFEVFHVKELPAKPSYLKFTKTIQPGENIVRFSLGPMIGITIYSTDASGFRDQIFLGRGFGYFSDKDDGVGARSSLTISDVHIQIRGRSPAGFL